MAEELVGTSDRESKLPTSVIAFLTIMFSFVAGVGTTAGVDALKKNSDYEWMYDFAMSFFFLVCAIDYARQLVRRTAGREVR